MRCITLLVCLLLLEVAVHPSVCEQPIEYGEFDFIVVGAGSAGAVVANRLSEESSWSVLLLEAGGEAPRTAMVPYLAPLLQKTPADWAYSTVPDGRTCLAMDGKASFWPRGKVLGGTSVFNYMMYVRGNRRDYDMWESLGNPGWSYDDVLPYFRKSEDNLDPEYAGSPYHGKGGYLSVETGPSTFLNELVLKAAEEMGYPITDCNGRNQTGFMLRQCTTRKGERCSTAKAFLDPVRGRRNLHITTFAQVHKVLIHEETKQAYGVLFKKDEKLYVAKARKEVVLSAGAIGSPHLLMLSGIGRKEHLQEMGIPFVHNLQGVGKNLQDHVGTLIHFLTDDTEYLLRPEDALTPKSILNWLDGGGSVMSIPGAVETTGFIHTKFSKASEDWPDIQIVFFGTCPFTEQHLDSPPFGMDKKAFREFYGPALGQQVWMAFPILMRPKSRGHLQLKSADPEEYPSIYPNYYADPNDVEVLIEGLKLVLIMAETESLRSINSTLWDRVFSGCEQHPKLSDAFWECYLKHLTMTVYHPVGTCKMGPNSDPEAVVDARLRVLGVNGLRVADASIMPTLVSGNTNAPSIMIGEKASDIVKEDWKFHVVNPNIQIHNEL